MGTGSTYCCPNCGYRKELHYGAGFRSFVSEEVKREILEGRYGRNAQRVVREHPDASCAWYRPLFHCTCGYYSVKDSVHIWGSDGLLYSPSIRCFYCHRKMWEVEDVTSAFPCPKCGTLMEETDFVCWD